VVERDRHLVAKVLSPNRVDIGRRLVSAGTAYRRYSMNYVAGEARPLCRAAALLDAGLFPEDSS
jgi:hypothetical protein